MIKLLTAEDLPLSDAYWDALAEMILPRYQLPPWAEPYSTEKMERWLERLDLKEDDFLIIGAWKNLADIPSTIPQWPLRAVVGLAMEEQAAINGGFIP